ncbi:hypothetical protein ACE02G_15695 [Shewanella xiamenensis]|nr:MULTISPECIES: hypothetical protein [Shewanella]
MVTDKNGCYVHGLFESEGLFELINYSLYAIVGTDIQNGLYGVK